jgi:isochorismate synthase
MTIVNKVLPSEKQAIALPPDLNAKELHIKLVQKTIDEIANNSLTKVVVSREEKLELSNVNPLDIYKRLLAKHSSAFVYCFFHPKVGLWLGATPETLLKTEGNRFYTTSLAGTQEYKSSLDVVWKEKEKNEQQLVTKFIENNLKIIVDNLKISETETVKAGNVLHLKTHISGLLKINNLDFKNLLDVLHPTPAVCGLPKDAAKQFILNNENYKRAFYTGFLGEINFIEKKSRNHNKHNVENNIYATVKKITNLYVNLRCMQLFQNMAILYVGGGITKDSNPEAEWEETINKTQTMKSVLY